MFFSMIFGIFPENSDKISGPSRTFCKGLREFIVPYNRTGDLLDFEFGFNSSTRRHAARPWARK